VYHTTGFDREEIIDLCIRIYSAERGTGTQDWPPCLGLFKSVAATLTYMRHNRTQAEIGESLGVSQPTVSRAISAVTPLIPEAVREFVPAADDLDPDAQYILDGTLLPCWSWDGYKELYSGKHKTTGMNVQVACTIYGKLAWISDPVDGSRHDNYCQEESGVLLTMNPKNWIGDKGYIGNNMIAPYREARRRRAARLAERIQYPGQQNSLDDRAGDLALQELGHHAHRLPASARHICDDHISGSWSSLLQDGLNNPL
jgi:DDE superfamily endonuclease/Helix-turn-helix of DDE superfamily endonuclease